TKEDYGTITNYICKERLHWTPSPLPPATSSDDPAGGGGGPKFADMKSATPFADARDYKILVNDWPYGLAPGITHIVVWLKNRLDTDDAEGDLTPESRALVAGFVKRTFVDRVGADRVMWFRNWTGLQSVREVEHIHVLLRGVSEEVVDGWTGRRTPLP
ncbi:MAG: hypothetical protein LQ338_006731, partial [Usnochroma carphineum]